MTLKMIMNYSDQILSTLKSTFGFESLRLQQENIIHSVLSGRDTLGVMPTGGGKSLCYQLPAMVMGKLAVVISPLISLMEDQVANLENLGITSAYINSSLDQEERKNVEERLKSGEIKVLFMA
ncbi:MAG: DEAD/DEAH box helicase, partial [Bdellovibrionota bacterium]|nr:DEAD/DEAH box helicase [Bdellovibrionota bacterium]